jgi:hypothetical protein
MSVNSGKGGEQKMLFLQKGKLVLARLASYVTFTIIGFKTAGRSASPGAP